MNARQRAARLAVWAILAFLPTLLFIAFTN